MRPIPDAHGSAPLRRVSDLDKLWAHVHDPSPKLLSLNPHLPRDLERALDRALAKHPEDRQQSAGELARNAFDALEG
jgi:serine/threonine protein kinase